MGQPADQRADVFAFGVVLYEMVCGVHPFRSATSAECQAAILKDEPVSLSTLVPAVPPMLEHLVRRCLQKRPQDRFQSARELLFALEELSTGPLETTPALPRRPWMRRLAVAAAALAAVLVAAVIMQRPSQGVPFMERDWLLITDVENLTGDPTFDNALDPAFTVAIEQSSYANVLSRTSIQPVLEQMRRAEVSAIDEALGREIAQRRGIDIVIVPSISRLGNRYVLTASIKDAASGDTYASRMVRASDIDGVLPALDRLCREVRTDLGETLASISERSRPLAEVTTGSLEALQQLSLAAERHVQSEPREAMKHYEAALRIDPHFTTAKVALAILHLDWGQFLPEADPEKGRALLEEAVTEIDSLTEPERLQALAHHAQFVEGDLERAAELFQTQLSVYPDLPQTHHNLAILFERLGRWDDAVIEYEQAIGIDPNIIASYNALVWLLRERYGDVPRIIYWAGRQLEIVDDQPWPFLNLSWAYIGMGDGPSAVEMAERAIEIAPGSMWAIYHLGHAQKFAGDHRAAAHSFATVFELDPNQTWAHYHAGHALALAGDREASAARFRAFAKKIEDLNRTGQPDEERFYPLWLDFARIRLGQAPEAIVTTDQLDTSDPDMIWYAAQRSSLTGRTEEALELLEKALDNGLANPIWAFAIPNFDPIRTDPRFQALQRQRLRLEDS
jgi:tetratricopeptide (TPR) repeat protein